MYHSLKNAQDSFVNRLLETLKILRRLAKKKINANDTNSGKESEHLLPRLECDHLERRRDPDFGSVSAKSCSGNSRPGLRCFLWLDHMVMIGSDDDLHS